MMTISLCLLDLFLFQCVVIQTLSTEAQVDRGANNRYDAKFMQFEKGQLSL